MSPLFTAFLLHQGHIMSKRLTTDEVRARLRKKNLELISEYINNTTKIKVKCYCGKIFDTMPLSIFAGHTNSCGCYKQELFLKHKSNRLNLVGQRFGRLMVISFSHRRKHINVHNKEYPTIYWNCLCDCGKYKKVSTASLRSGRVLSCGCYRREITIKRSFTGCGEIYGSYYAGLKCGARNRNIEFNISVTEMWDQWQKQDGKCALTGELLTFQKYNGKKNGNSVYISGTASLDRIDNTLGYIKSNIQWIHKDINVMKLDHSQKDFINLCKQVADYSRNNLDDIEYYI